MQSLRLSEKVPHPLEQLTIAESKQARDVVLRSHNLSVIDFRTISLEEPPKAQLQKFLEVEHSGNLHPSTPRPDRLARVTYDVIGGDKIAVYNESVIDVRNSVEVGHETIDAQHHAALTMYVPPAPRTQRVCLTPLGGNLITSSKRSGRHHCSKKPSRNSTSRQGSK